MVDTSALRTQLLRESASQRRQSREMAEDALQTDGLLDSSREYFTAVLSVLTDLEAAGNTSGGGEATPSLPSADQANRRRQGGQRGGNQYGSYTVRYASDKQAAYLRHLFASRDYSGKVGPALAELNRAARELETGKIALRLASDAIDTLLTCPVVDHQEAVRLTERQEATIRKIAPRKAGGDAAVSTMLNVRGLSDVSDLSKDDASKLLNILFDSPWLPRETSAPSGNTDPVTEGMYQTSDGTVYKVQRSRDSGRLYAKRLDPDTQRFEYASGAMRKLTADDRMTLEAAAAYGKLYGVCCVCGRELTNEDSIEAGIGPICAQKI